jgi:hypothetical protein
VVRIFKNEWSAEKRRAGTVDDLNRELAVSDNAASEAQKGNQNAVKDKNDFANIRNGLTQAARAEQNGISKRSQETLDRIARESPALLAEIQAGTKTIHAEAWQPNWSESVRETTGG